MKVIRSLDTNEALPINNIKKFSVIDIEHDWHDQTIDDWYKLGNNRYVVKVYYTICTGETMIIYSANTIDECFTYIENL